MPACPRTRARGPPAARPAASRCLHRCLPCVTQCVFMYNENETAPGTWMSPEGYVFSRASAEGGGPAGRCAGRRRRGGSTSQPCSAGPALFRCWPGRAVPLVRHVHRPCASRWPYALPQARVGAWERNPIPASRSDFIDRQVGRQPTIHPVTVHLGRAAALAAPLQGDLESRPWQSVHSPGPWGDCPLHRKPQPKARGGGQPPTSAAHAVVGHADVSKTLHPASTSRAIARVHRRVLRR